MVYMYHTCDEFESGFREIFLSSQGGFWKMYIYKKILGSFQGDFKVFLKKWYILVKF